ncbi:MAG: hypothetical protein JSV84_14700 [Gemmatimonadota bacterium]|nr:MAG: hypothetical protein JSV84_14700 [Gemmatimonadota bacterium]
MFPRIPFLIVLSMSIICLFFRKLHAQEEGGKIVVISERVGEVIDVKGRNRFYSLQAINNFGSVILPILQGC